MKIIHDPPNCPLCEYSRQGLEAGRSCPECGLALFPGAPVFDLSPPAAARGLRWRLLVWGGFNLSATVLMMNWPKNWLPIPPVWRMVPLGLIVSGAIFLWFAFRPADRPMFLLTIDGIAFTLQGRVRWHVRYNELAEFRVRRILGMIVFTLRSGKRRVLPLINGRHSATIVSALDDELARQRRIRGAEEPLPDGRGSDGTEPRLH